MNSIRSIRIELPASGANPFGGESVIKILRETLEFYWTSRRARRNHNAHSDDLHFT